MTYIAIFALGLIAARWLIGPLAALLRLGILIISVAVAYRVTAFVLPDLVGSIDWRGFWSGASLGLIVAIVTGALWFYMLGWRARVATTEQDEIDRARQKAIKDRKLA